MSPVRKLAFYVLLQAVADVRGGAELEDEERGMLTLWALSAGIRPSRAYWLIDRARRGELVDFRMPWKGAVSDKPRSGAGGGAKPFGSRPGDELTVERILGLKRSGLGPYLIADELNRAGIPAARGGAWSGPSVARLLKRALGDARAGCPC